MRLQQAGLAKCADRQASAGRGLNPVYRITAAGKNALLGQPVRIEE